MSKKTYKEFNIKETETIINIIYDEDIMHFYTNKVTLQRKLNKLIGEPQKEYKVKRSIVGSCWDIPLSDKNKISKIILKANIFNL